MKNKILNEIVDISCVSRKKDKFYCLRSSYQDQLSYIKKEDRGLLSFLKEYFKKYNKLYYLLVCLFSSVYFSDKLLKKKLKKYLNRDKVIVNLASGNKKINEEIINIDLCDYDNVDIIADIKKLPLKKNVADLVLCESILEHEPETGVLLSQVYKILKKDGKIFFVIPFVFPYHSSPGDYYRWTDQGLIKLFQKHGFKNINIKIKSGVGSALTGITIEFFSCIFSFGNKFLYDFFFIIFSLIFWPIKFFDIFLNYNKFSKNCAAFFVLEAQK